MSMSIVPFVGVGEYKLMSRYNEVLFGLKAKGIRYTVEVWSNRGCTPEVEWRIIHVDGNINLFFAKDFLFKIYIDGTFDGCLQNGIGIGSSMEKAKKIDSSLRYDDWNEDWSSELGYWLEDDIENDSVMSITVFIPALLDEEQFNEYRWCNES